MSAINPFRDKVPIYTNSSQYSAAIVAEYWKIVKYWCKWETWVRDGLKPPVTKVVVAMQNNSSVPFKGSKRSFAKPLKLVSTIFYEFFIISQNDSLSKTMKNVFYFI